MLLTKGVGEFFGLDIGTTAVRAVQLAHAGEQKWSLLHYAYVPIDQKVAEADSDDARRRLSEAVTTAIGQSGIKIKDVAIGLPSNKTFVTVVDMPKMPLDELAGVITYQADEFIPMANEDTKVDWKVLGPSLADTSKQEVLLASTANEFSEQRVDLLEQLGLNVVAAEPDSLAMIRAVTSHANEGGAQLIIDIGETSTDVVVMYENMPRLVRTIPNGVATLVQAAVQHLSVEKAQARQFIMKFGLSTDKLEGQVLRALTPTLDGFISELRKSVGFFESRYPTVPVKSMTLSGVATTIPRLGEYIGAKSGIAATSADPWQRVSVVGADERLAVVRAEFSVAIGLAQRSGRV